MEDFLITKRERVCDNNCEQIESVIETIIKDSNVFNYDDIYNGPKLSPLFLELLHCTKRITIVRCMDNGRISITIKFDISNIPKRKKLKNDYSNNAVPTKMHSQELSQDPNPVHDMVSCALESHNPQHCQSLYCILTRMDYQNGHIYEDEVQRLADHIDRMQKAIYEPRTVVQEQHNHNCQQFMGEIKSPNFITQSKDEAI